MPFEGRIEEIWVEAAGEHHTVYRPGEAVKVAEVPVGKVVHLHVITTASWPEVAPWATAITYLGELTAGNARRCMGGGCDYAFELPVAVMPDRTLNIGRVRFWKNRAYTNVPPPEEAR